MTYLSVKTEFMDKICRQYDLSKLQQLKIEAVFKRKSLDELDSRNLIIESMMDELALSENVLMGISFGYLGGGKYRKLCDFITN